MTLWGLEEQGDGSDLSSEVKIFSENINSQFASILAGETVWKVRYKAEKNQIRLLFSVE
jgi:hypothetical protein